MGPIGILALQGCVDPHITHLNKIGAERRLVKLPADLQGLSGLILPGGESTTMIRLAKSFGLWEELSISAEKIPFWGVCAGSILMARSVEGPKQESLNVMDFTAERNAYGRQLDSFEGEVTLQGFGQGESHKALFIRAPKFSQLGPRVTTKGVAKGIPVFLEEGKHMVTACHPELTDDSWFHRYFLEKVKSA